MTKPTNLLGAEHRLLHHITATHILPTSGGHEKISYKDLYIMWHVVTGKPLNLPHLIMKNMLRATSKVEGALPYGMVITKILSHFGIVFGNEVASRLDVGDIYNASSLKRMRWKMCLILIKVFNGCPRKVEEKERELKVKVMRMLKRKEKLKEKSKPLHHKCSKVKQLEVARLQRPWMFCWMR
ncbi:hypothetical protein CFOL_v3_34408 [Cephalotus follicularis]|uniref:Putative plant transposon protein domain-containing protein n=1 Tax=Cephalotus follicularis TaxID=3775 RepID=A0A1Q3DFI4_CEPFO|nr:hypothetical protein CFOL_v3_34408 [Cephalotus follicularis]